MPANGKMRSLRPCGQNLSSLTKKEREKKRKAKRNLKTHKIVVWLSLFRSEIRKFCNNGKQMIYIQEKHCFKQSNYTMYFHRYLVNLIWLLFSEAKYIICLVTFWPCLGTPEAVFVDYTLHGMLASGKMRSLRPCGQNFMFQAVKLKNLFSSIFC